MAAKSVGACEAATATPVAAGAEFAAADEFLLAAVETFVAFAVVLACESLAADGANKGTFVGVGAEMGAEVVGSCETFGTEVALKCGWMFLHAAVCASGRGAVWVGELEDVVTVWNGGGGRAAHAGS